MAAGAQFLEPSSAVFPDILLGTQKRSGAAGLEVVPVGDVGAAGGSPSYQNTVLVPNILCSFFPTESLLIS